MEEERSCNAKTKYSDQIWLQQYIELYVAKAKLKIMYVAEFSLKCSFDKCRQMHVKFGGWVLNQVGY